MVLKRPSYRKRYSQSSGALLPELSLVLPIFLSGVMLFVWLGSILNARASLSAAISRSVRLAIPRAPRDVIPELSDWVFNVSDDGTAIAPLLSSDANKWSQGAASFYEDPVDGPLGAVFGESLRDADPVYAYSLAYFYRSLSQSVGSSVKYPCDPSGPDGAGCVSCQFLNPVTRDETVWDERDEMNNLLPPPTDALLLSCRYRPSGLFAEQVHRVLDVVLGNGASRDGALVFHRQAGLAT